VGNGIVVGHVQHFLARIASFDNYHAPSPLFIPDPKIRWGS
jgi:hypothetical protein